MPKIFLLLAFFYLGACRSDPHAQALQTLLNSPLKPGVGVGTLQVRQTDYATVLQLLGPPTQESAQEGQTTACNPYPNCTDTAFVTHTLRYAPAGLWVEFEKHSTGAKERLTIERLGFECAPNKPCPYQGKTPAGIGLGDTRATLLQRYPNPLRQAHNSWVIFYGEGWGAGFDSAERRPQPTDPINTLQVMATDSEALNS